MAENNIFDTLLGQIAEADRTAFTEIAERNPDLKAYIGDPEKVKRVEEVEKWYANEWDFEHESPKKEYALGLKVQELETQLGAAKVEVEAAKTAVVNASVNGDGEEDMANAFEKLSAMLDEKIKSGAVVSAAQVKTDLDAAIAAKEAEFSQSLSDNLNVVARAATQVPYLNRQHERDFGDQFDPDEFLTKANEAKAGDLKDFYYKSYAAEKYTAKQAADATKAQAELDAKLAAARDEGRKSALQERVGQEGQNPSIEGSPEMGHFQARMMKIEPKEGESSIPKDAVLGRGQIAAAAARDFERAKLTNGVA